MNKRHPFRDAFCLPHQLSVIMKGKEKRGNISKNKQQRVLRC